jgi:hypothetical protein
MINNPYSSAIKERRCLICQINQALVSRRRERQCVISSNILEKSEFAANSESLIPFIAKSWVFSEIANPRSSCSMIDLDMGKDTGVHSYTHE